MVGIMAKGSESPRVDVVGSPIRAGMKREFMAMMKAQVGHGVSVGPRRVTRSQNVSLRSGSVLRSPEKETGGKRRRKETKRVVKNEGEGEGVGEGEEEMVELEDVEERDSEDGEEVVEKLEAKRGRKESKRVDGEKEKGGEEVEEKESQEGEEVVEISEDDEPKSDVLDGSIEEDGKVEVVEVTKGGDGSLGEFENVGVEVEKESGVERNKVDIESNVARKNVDNEIESNVARTNVEVDSIDAKSLEIEKNSLENDVRKGRDYVENDLEKVNDMVKETDIENVEVVDNCATPKDELNVSVVDGVNKELHEIVDSQEMEVKSDLKSGKGVEAVFVSAEGSGEVSVPDKPLRRFTRSALKQNDLPPETSREKDDKDTEPSVMDHVSTMNTPAKAELKLSKRTSSKRPTLKLKELLETGLLEGLHVRYTRGPKVKGQHETVIKGVIKGSGILCYCDKCNSSEIVTPNQFELHAGSANKRPPEYIFLDNGKSLRDVLNICKNVPCESLEQAIESAIGCLTGKSSTFCLNCKGQISVTGTGRITILCDSCIASKESQGSPTRITDNSERSSVCVSGTKSCEQMAYSSRSKSKGRLTRKDLRMHKLVFEDDVLPDGTALAYYSHGKKMLEGYKKGFGIFCYCCENEVSPSVFEAHAGYGSRRKPYLSIYISNGVSLHELSVRLAKERKISAEENDDLCSICGDGGDLLCCDSCPRAFHADCVSLPNPPQGAWHCRYCESTFLKEKFVEHNANAIAAGRVLGSDPLDQLMKRCIRIVENLDADFCACILCRGKDFSKSGFGPQTVIICDQCEKEYHIGCLKEHNMDDLKELPEGKWFCCVECDKVHTALEKLVADGEMPIPELLLAMIKEKHANLGSNDIPELDVRWRLLRGKMANEDTRKLFSGAVTIFHERFDPIADTKSSRLDLIPQMVYGRNFKDQDLGGMYTAVLTINSTVVCAGIIRIFGQAVAELPLVATNTEHQGQGYFQCLFSCMENLLASLDVKNLVLPAAEEAESLWINKFGFEKMTVEEMKDYRKDYQMMIFQGTSMLHKAVQKS